MSDEEDSQGDGSEDNGQSDSDESYDYGFIQDDEHEDYEIGYQDMNVSPDILRLLGASEEVIAAKEEEISTIKWEAPKETGLEHSSAIANFDDVALSGGKVGPTSGSTQQRIFKTVGSYDGPSKVGHTHPTSDIQTSDEKDPQIPGKVLKVKISQGPEAVPKGKESKLPPAPVLGGGDDGDSASDTSWDEESVIDGHAWWEDLSDEEPSDGLTERISSNLRTALGLTDLPDDPTKLGHDWRPPSSSGLGNSKPLVTLQPVGIGKNKGIEVKYMAGCARDGEGQGSADNQEDSDDEDGWDYTDIPDEDYILEWSTRISPNLYEAIGSIKSHTNLARKLSQEISWRPPTSHGLANSAPIINAALGSKK